MRSGPRTLQQGCDTFMNGEYSYRIISAMNGPRSGAFDHSNERFTSLLCLILMVESAALIDARAFWGGRVERRGKGVKPRSDN